ncbi:PREDICTED: uncharacterized protein LOC104612413 isoform X1 [Nelumbo nucifera]|nr:PREDICTED: uncharacterized protein LOC104612413 isoform X1 [Nelumbo nucifera]XP_010278117.1 PREDICTED: uncharacterized protein LOC104612413 isoform X1 [Nelumbo nucifera]
MEITALDSVGLPGFPPELAILPKINVENNNDESMKELRLTPDSSNQCTERGLNDDSGAGANAASRSDMMFVTANPLSELVWSPHRGLSLKCAECSFAERKPSILWGGGSNMVLSLPQSIKSKEINNDGHEAGGTSTSLGMASHFVCSTDRVRSPRSTMDITSVSGKASDEHTMGSGGDMEVLNTTKETSVLDTSQKLLDHSDHKEKDKSFAAYIPTETSKTEANTISSLPNNTCIPGPENGETAHFLSKQDEQKHDSSQAESRSRYVHKETSSDPFVTTRVGNGNNDTEDIEVASASEGFPVRQCKSLNSAAPILTAPSRKRGRLASDNDEEGKNKMKLTDFSLEKCELTDENALEPLKGESTCAEVDVILTPKPSDEIKHVKQQNKRKLLKEQGASSETSPNNRELCLHQREDKDKFLYGEEIKIPKEEDDSHESVESCNSAGLSSAGKRPWSFEQKLVVGDKRLKKQIHENPGSSSLMKQHSSFMTWISNMMKGLSQTDPDVPSSLALTVRPHHGHGCFDQHSMSHDNQNPGYGSMGFQTMFRALCSPNKMVQETRTLNLVHQSGEIPKEPELVDEVRDNNFTLPACGEDDKLHKQSIVPSENFNLEMSQHREGNSNVADISSAHTAFPMVNHKSDGAENNNSGKIASGTVKCRVSSSTSSFRKDSESPYEGKETCKFGFIDPNKSSTSVPNRSSFLGSSWITRFSLKVPNSESSSPICKENADIPAEYCSEGTGILPHPQNCIVTKDQNYLEDAMENSVEHQMDIASRKFNRSAVNSSASLALKETEGQFDQKFKSKLKVILPSQRFKSSEDMASVFARRLDALRHIITSEIADSATCVIRTCLFCGIRGHNLQDCSEIIESEIEDLIRNINSYGGCEESPCLCIRCFQLNHWAVACPNVSLKRESHLDGDASLVNLSSDKNHQNPENNTITHWIERYLRLSENKDRKCQDSTKLTTHDSQSSRMDDKALACKNAKKFSSGKAIVNDFLLDSKPGKDILANNTCEGTKKHRVSVEYVLNGKKIASNFMENESKDNLISSFSNHITRQIPDVPRGTFEAIRKLRLSRADILKWMKSPISAFSLEGFFVRLRLGKWEEGLGGTGYYVAYINGMSRDRSVEGSEIPLSVDIGGFKSIVESRYLSNHDFIEDELMAWWCTISRSTRKLPSEEDLKMKLEERKKFGF